MILDLELQGELPEGWMPLETVSVIKCLDEEGNPAITVRTTPGWTEWEMLGALMATCDQLRSSMKSDFTDGRDT